MTELRRATPFLLVPLLLFVAGCSLLPWTLPGASPSGPPANAAALADLADHRAAWRAAGIDSYTMTVRFGCFCPATDPVVVRVVDGLVESVRTEAGAAAPDRLSGFPLTVDAIFDQAAQALQNGGSAAIDYGPDGVPVSVSLDPIPNAVDDELGIEVLDFSPAA